MTNWEEEFEMNKNGCKVVLFIRTKQQKSACSEIIGQQTFGVEKLGLHSHKRQTEKIEKEKDKKPSNLILRVLSH